MLGAFSCADARCDSPAERAYLLMQIRLRWGSEAASSTPLCVGTSPRSSRGASVASARSYQLIQAKTKRQNDL